MYQYDSCGEKEEQNSRRMQENETNNDTNLKTIQSNSSFQSTVNRFKNYMPRSNCVDLAYLKQSQSLRIKKSKQYAYYGEIVNNLRHGMGIMLYGDCGVYQGSWVSDKKHGKGYQCFQNGNCYEGQFVEGKRQGLGRFLWKNGQFYEGQWSQNTKQGSGTWRSPQGDSYVGQWKQNKSHGFGVHVWRNGDRYQGYFVDCLKHGQGYQRNAQGDLYRGNFYKGQKHGYGEYYWSDGSYYAGEFKNGKKQGKGLWKSNKQEEYYQGSYKNGKREGYGVYVWSNGIVYKGYYHQDLKEGYGEMFWPSGQYYKGSWKADQQHGEAQTYAPSIGIKRCSFANNVIIEEIEEIEEDQQAKLSIKQPKEKHFHRIGQKIYNSRALESRVAIFTDSPMKDQLSRIYLNSNRLSNNSVSTTKKGKTTNRTKRNSQRKFNTVRKESTLKLEVSQINKCKFDLSPKAESPIYAYKTIYKKQQIPHSSFYLHQIHRRVKTSMQDSSQQITYCKKYSEHKLQPTISPETKPSNLTKLMQKYRFGQYKAN